MTKESEDLFYRDIKQLLIDVRKDAYRKINSLMVETYWEIGRRIVEQEQQGKGRAGYGEYLISSLSKYLGDPLGKGFSVANLWNFRQFYLVFRDNQKLYTLCRELSWSHIRLIIRIDDDNPTIGIIFWTDKDETIVIYSILQENKHLFASKYRTILPSERLDLYGTEKAGQDYE
ncbi:MAG: DUF1016 N-terminal domain-containing protein [Spirochaetaceae bacterium]|nr:DUF1016 N-terminal domain-containing protein [Spirochaetaceae bacterium]